LRNSARRSVKALAEELARDDADTLIEQEAAWCRERTRSTGQPDLDLLKARKDTLAERALARERFFIGIGLANLINLFTPDAIVLGGSGMKGAGRELDRIRELIRQGCRFVPLESVAIELGSLGDDANLIGAACVWQHCFGDPRVSI